MRDGGAVADGEEPTEIDWRALLAFALALADRARERAPIFRLPSGVARGG
jgi:hypothetical protein